MIAEGPLCRRGQVKALEGVSETIEGTQATPSTRPAWLPWLLVLLGGAIGLRALSIAAGGPLTDNDTIGYVSLGKSLLSLNLAGDLGMRTPVYPLFIGLMGFDGGLIRTAQLCLGLITTVLLFYTAFSLTRSGPLALLAGVAYGWSPVQISFENFMMTEALSTFLLVCAIALYAKAARSDRPSPWLFLALGLVAALGVLARPVLAVVPVILLIALWIRRDGRRAIVLVALAGLGPILAWSAFNYARLDYFGPTTVTGGNLTNHTGAYIEDAPARYATIKRIYLAARAVRTAHHEDNVNIIWQTWPAMSAQTGQAWPQLSQTLTRMSAELIATHPVQYGRAVVRNLARFWIGTGWIYEHPPRGSIDSAMIPVTQVWRAAFALMCALTLALSVVAAIRAIRAHVPGGPLVAVLGVVLLVLITGALLASMIENDDLRRYGLPFTSLIGLLAALAVQRWMQTRRLTTPGSDHGEDALTPQPADQVQN